MKKYLAISLTALALLALSLSAPAFEELSVAPNGPAYTYFSTSATNPAAATSFVIVSVNTKIANATPLVVGLGATSDLAGSRVQAYQVTAVTTESLTNSTVTLPVASTNGFLVGDVVIARHLADDTYEKLILTTFTTNNALTTTLAPQETTVPGDILYRCTTNGAPCFVLTTNSMQGASQILQLNGGPIMAGQPGKPLLLEVKGTSSATLQNVCVQFVP